MRKGIGNTIETRVWDVPKFLEAKAFISPEKDRCFIARGINPKDVYQLYPIKISTKGSASQLATPLLCDGPYRMKKLNKLYAETEASWEDENIEVDTGGIIDFHTALETLMKEPV